MHSVYFIIILLYVHLKKQVHIDNLHNFFLDFSSYAHQYIKKKNFLLISHNLYLTAATVMINTQKQQV